MATKIVTYGQLRQALERLGLRQTFSSAHHTTYMHAPSGAILLLPNADNGENARASYLITAERMVVDNGLADEQMFEDLLKGDAQ